MSETPLKPSSAFLLYWTALLLLSVKVFISSASLLRSSRLSMYRPLEDGLLRFAMSSVSSNRKRVQCIERDDAAAEVGENIADGTA
jgi:uncharacterized protein (DUF58 family)